MALTSASSNSPEVETETGGLPALSGSAAASEKMLSMTQSAAASTATSPASQAQAAAARNLISRNQAPGRLALPVSALIALAVAGLLLLGYFVASPITARWSSLTRMTFFVAIGVLILFSLQTFVEDWIRKQSASMRKMPVFQRNRVHIPKEGLMYLGIMIVLLVGSMLGQSNMMMLVFAVMAGPFVLNGWAAFTALQGSKVSRTLPKRAMCGEQFSVEVSFRNDRPLLSAWMMLVRDQARPAKARHSQIAAVASVLFTRVGPKSIQLAHYRIRLGHRGRYIFGPLSVSSRYPLGLIERGLVVNAHEEMLVYPIIGRLHPRWKRELVGASELVTSSQSRGGIYNDDFHHLREYRSGDNPKAIHWRSSARRNELIVREFHQNREHHLSVVVDLHRSAHPTPEEDLQAELILSFVATLCAEHSQTCRESTVRLAISGESATVYEAAASPANLEFLLDQLALAEPGAATTTTSMLAEAQRILSANTRLVLVTSRLHGKTTENDLSHAQTGRAQVIHIDPSTYADYVVLDQDFAPRGTSILAENDAEEAELLPDDDL